MFYGDNRSCAWLVISTQLLSIDQGTHSALPSLIVPTASIITERRAISSGCSSVVNGGGWGWLHTSVWPVWSQTDIISSHILRDQDLFDAWKCRRVNMSASMDTSSPDAMLTVFTLRRRRSWDTQRIGLCAGCHGAARLPGNIRVYRKVCFRLVFDWHNPQTVALAFSVTCYIIIYFRRGHRQDNTSAAELAEFENNSWFLCSLKWER